MSGCTEHCWTPVPCPTCGQDLPPRGCHEVELPDCCDDHRYDQVNTRHLWSAHDTTRDIHDPAGWAEHLARCSYCRIRDRIRDHE